MTEKNACVDFNKEINNKIHPKRLILKWRNQHKHKISINLPPPASPEPEPVPPPSTVAAASGLPWNLRDRSRIFPSKKLSEETTTTTTSKPKLATKKESMPKLAVSLSESEIMEDFLKMTGKMPPSKPKKRARAVQRNLDNMYLGLSLMKISSDRYHVSEPSPSTNKMKKIGHKKQLP